MKNLKKVYKFNINHSVIRQLSTHAYSGISLTSISNSIFDNSWSIESLKKKIIDNTWSIDDLNLFKDIDMTDLTNSLAGVNLSGSIAVFCCLYTIITAFYGNKLIEYFQLEKKYPKIGRFIQLRRKFQLYYSLIDFFLIFIVASTIIFINILIYVQ